MSEYVLPYQPRPYQVEGIDWIAQYKRVILGDEMRLGKSMQTLLAWKKMGIAYTGRFLIMGRKNALYNWSKEVPKWLGPNAKCFFITGNAVARKAMWEQSRTVPGFYFVVPKVVNDDHKLGNANRKWDGALCDEFHRYLRKHTSKMFSALKDVIGTAKTIVLISGSPISKGAQDLFAPLHLLDPRYWSSWWGFVNEYCEVDRSGFGMEIVGVKNPTKLKEKLKVYLLRRLRKNVLSQVPQKQRQFLWCELEGKQRAAYNNLNEQLLHALEGYEDQALIAQNQMIKYGMLRQLMVCPHSLGVADEGDGLREVMEHIEDNDKHSCVIFTPFVKAIPNIVEILKSRLEMPVNVLQGGITVKQIDAEIASFEASKGIMVCSIMFAEAFSLATASVAYFLGTSPVPGDNFQAEDRLIDAANPDTNMYYYVRYKDTIDESRFTTLDDRHNMAEVVLSNIPAPSKLTVARLKELIAQ